MSIDPILLPVQQDPNRPAPTCAFEDITPAMAQQWLDANHRNRHLQDANVARIRGVINRGEWMDDSTDAIGLDVDGGVVNGQHRLTAIAEGTETVRALVVRNVRPEVIKVIDQGLPRGLQQILALTGLYQYTSDLAGAINNLWRIANDYEKTMPQAVKPSVPQLLDFFLLHPHITDSISVAVDVTRPFKFFQRSWVAPYHYLMATIDAEDADEFFVKLESGVEITNGDPVYALREKILANGASAKPEPSVVLAAWLVKAWEAHREQRELTKANLKYIYKGARAESFPKVAGVDFEPSGNLLVLNGDEDAA